MRCQPARPVRSWPEVIELGLRNCQAERRDRINHCSSPSTLVLMRLLSASCSAPARSWDRRRNWLPCSSVRPPARCSPGAAEAPPTRSHFHAAEMLTEADMGAIAERDMLVGRALDVVFERVGEDRLVAIARRVTQHQPVALGDLLARDFGVGSGGAHEVLHRRDPADRLFDWPGISANCRPSACGTVPDSAPAPTCRRPWCLTSYRAPRWRR